MTGRQIIEAIAKYPDIDIEYPVKLLRRNVDGKVVKEERVNVIFNVNGEMFIEEAI